MRSLLLLALLGCGSSPKVDPAVPAGDPAPCAGVAANIVKFIDQSSPVDKVRTLLEQHCRDDKWSEQTRKCVISGKVEKDLDTCEQYFTKAQLDAFTKDLATVIPASKAEPAPAATGSDVPPAANVIPN